jgi:multiple sugar transport system substrate-binding protein
MSRGRTLTRRAMLATGAAAASVGLLAGCGLGGPPVQAKKPGIDLTIWFPGTDTTEIELVTKHIVPAFEKEHGVTLQVTYVDWNDLSPKLNAAFAGGTAPDVFGHGPAAVAGFASEDRIENLDHYVAQLPESERKDTAAAYAGGKVSGSQYLIPLSIDSQFLAYDARTFDSAGIHTPPTTWEGVRDAAEELTVRKNGTITRDGLTLPTNVPIGIQQSFTSLLYAHGGSMVDADTDAPTFATEKGAQALQFLTDLHHGPHAVTGSIGRDNGSLPPAQNPLLVGGSAMVMSSAPGIHQMLAAQPDAELRALPALAFTDGDKPSGFGGAGNGLMVNADSPEKDLGWAFIAYMTSADVNTTYTEGLGALPIRESAKKSAYVKDSPVLSAAQETVGLLRPNPNIPGWVEGRDRIGQHLERAVNQQVGAREALDNASSDVASIFGRGQ